MLLFEMENYEEGDLTDIVRGGRRSRSCTSNCKTEADQEEEDHSPFSSSQDNNPQWTSWQFSSQLLLQDHHHQNNQYSFGDPFCSATPAALSMRAEDPLLLHQELDILCAATTNTNNVSSSSSSSTTSSSSSAAFFNGISCRTTEDELIKRPSNIFSRMLQISPSPNKFPTISSHNSPSNFLIPNSPTTPHPDLRHFLDHNPNLNPNNNPSPTALHISSPRNPPGIKRRKSQARKVVCVPAPVAASSRPNGEVIPSDLWAWRKYGQKPIKGSPYPRGYYRCSSSKGCSARKQVERSRTDPNMLVITYTSEHNHPWPTQRNALAGSSRSQQSKNNNTTTTTPPNSSKISSPTAQPQNPALPTTHQDHHKNKEEEEEEEEEDQNNNNGTLLPPSSAAAASNNNNVKEEEIENQHHHQLISEGFDEDHDFFADLEELQTDPLTLLFTQPHKLDQIKGGATTGCINDVVAFNNLFDWPPPQNNNNSTPFQEQQPPPPPPATPTNRGFY